MTALLDLAALVPWLEAHVAGFSGPVSVSAFGVGQSNPTYRLATPDRDYVLRRKPPGTLVASAHAVDREFRILSALHPLGFPVPRPHALCMDEAVIGSIFYVMDMVAGPILKDGGLPDLVPANREQIYFALTDTLASLHVIDPAEAGLADYGRPDNYYQRQIDRWTRQLATTRTGPLPAMDELAEALPAGIPDQFRVRIVHGDFRLDNVIMSPTHDRVLAVLDWELSTLGDALGDLAYFLLSWVLPKALSPNDAGLGDRDIAALAIPGIEAIVARYQEKTGLADIGGLNWRIAFNLFRLAAIYQGIAARVAAGNAVGSDANSYGARVEPMARLALERLAIGD
ncbi:phosphotransferase family protein [Sphingobium aromaticivastans]|uniref:phosphotransferase family protein n=1 Tax=Sphingobium aromaticivastans TaxID=1778665 RepID=UPI003017F173